MDILKERSENMMEAELSPGIGATVQKTESPKVLRCIFKRKGIKMEFAIIDNGDYVLRWWSDNRLGEILAKGNANDLA